MRQKESRLGGGVGTSSVSEGREIGEHDQWAVKTGMKKDVHGGLAPSNCRAVLG